MTTAVVILPEELSSYLVSHPDLFSDVLAHAFAKKQQQHRDNAVIARTFGMPKKKRDADDDDDDDHSPKKAHVDLVDLFHDMLIIDHRDKIYEQLIGLMDTAEDVLVALLQLGAVSTTIRDEVAHNLKKFIKKSDLIGVACRNVVMYFDQPLVRDLYIDALALKAPMAHQAWKRILEEPLWRACLETYLVPMIHEGLSEIPHYIRSGRDPVFILASVVENDAATAPLHNRHPTSFRYTVNEIVALVPAECTPEQFETFSFDAVEPYLRLFARAEDPHEIQSEFLNGVCRLALSFGRQDVFVVQPGIREMILVHLTRALFDAHERTLRDRASLAESVLRLRGFNPAAIRILLIGGLLYHHHGAPLDLIKAADALSPPAEAIQWGSILKAAVSFHRVDVLDLLYRKPSFVMSRGTFQEAIRCLTHQEYALTRKFSGKGQLETFKALLRLVEKPPLADRPAFAASMRSMLLTISHGRYPTISDELGRYLAEIGVLTMADDALIKTAMFTWKVATATVFDPSAWLITTDRFATVVTTKVHFSARAQIVLEIALATDYADPGFMRQLIDHFVAIYRTIQERTDLPPSQKDAICADIFVARGLFISQPLQAAIHWTNFWMYIESPIGFSLHERLLMTTPRAAAYFPVAALRLLPCSADPWRFVLVTLRTPRPPNWLLDMFRMHLSRFHQLPPSAQTPAAIKFFVENLKAYARQSNGVYIEPTRTTSNVHPIDFIFNMVERDMQFVDGNA